MTTKNRAEKELVSKKYRKRSRMGEIFHSICQNGRSLSSSRLLFSCAQS